MACKAWLMEIHPTLAIKSPGLGDPEAGWVTHLNRNAAGGGGRAGYKS